MPPLQGHGIEEMCRDDVIGIFKGILLNCRRGKWNGLGSQVWGDVRQEREKKASGWHGITVCHLNAWEEKSRLM